MSINAKDQILHNHETGVPFTHQTLTSLLGKYMRPNEKINDLVKEGFIESVKRGIYIPGKNTRAVRPDDMLLANYLLGPSYVSMDFVLSWYGLIPEKVYEVSSVTPKSSREFQTIAGIFTYTQLRLPYYAFGQTTIKLPNGLYAIGATPEKALFDKIVTTPGIMLRSKSAARDYVFDNLRMDESDVKKFKIEEMRKWGKDAPKANSLSMLIKMLEKL